MQVVADGISARWLEMYRLVIINHENRQHSNIKKNHTQQWTRDPFRDNLK